MQSISPALESGDGELFFSVIGSAPQSFRIGEILIGLFAPWLGTPSCSQIPIKPY